jgi:hypothetical protein
MARNPFRRPYVFSKKWAAWIGVGFPIVLYIVLTAPDAKKSDAVSTTITALIIYIALPWASMRIFRALRKKSPQGKIATRTGETAHGDVLSLKVGYRPRLQVQAKLVDGFVEIPTGKIAVTEIKSIKVKDPRPISIKVLINTFAISMQVLYFYFICQPLILLFVLVYIPILEKQLGNPQNISVDQRFEQLQNISFLSVVIHSQALLQPTLIAFSIIIFMTIIKPFISKTVLVIVSNSGNTLVMPFSYSLNPYIQVFVESRRAKRFIKRVRKAKNEI